MTLVDDFVIAGFAVVAILVVYFWRVSTAPAMGGIAKGRYTVDLKRQKTFKQLKGNLVDVTHTELPDSMIVQLAENMLEDMAGISPVLVELRRTMVGAQMSQTQYETKIKQIAYDMRTKPASFFSVGKDAHWEFYMIRGRSGVTHALYLVVKNGKSVTDYTTSEEKAKLTSMFDYANRGSIAIRDWHQFRTPFKVGGRRVVCHFGWPLDIGSAQPENPPSTEDLVSLSFIVLYVKNYLTQKIREKSLQQTVNNQQMEMNNAVRTIGELQTQNLELKDAIGKKGLGTGEAAKRAMRPLLMLGVFVLTMGLALAGYLYGTSLSTLVGAFAGVSLSIVIVSVMGGK